MGNGQVDDLGGHGRRGHRCAGFGVCFNDTTGPGSESGRQGLGVTTTAPTTAPQPAAPPSTTTTAAPATTAPPTTSSPQTTAEQWNNEYGNVLLNLVDSLGGWIAGFQQLNSTGDASGLTQGCQLIEQDLQQLEGTPPMPDSMAEGDRQSAISSYTTGYNVGCTGTTDLNVLAQAHSSLAQGQNDLAAASARIDQIETTGAGG